MNCCEKCFNDKHLKKIFYRTGYISTCFYCGSENVKCIDEVELYELFKNIFDLYGNVNKDQESIFAFAKKEKVLATSSLVKLLQSDWNIFNEDNLNYNNIAEMIHNISKGRITEEEILSNNWIKAIDTYYGYYTSKDWNLFCENIKNKNRFYPHIEYEDEIGYKTTFKDNLYELKIFQYAQNSIKKGTIFYRARIGYNIDKKTNTIKPFKFKDLGIPPKNILTNGRANPLGINYLYTSDEMETVLSEVRAWKTSIVTVGEIICKKDLNIVDLTAIVKIEFPFDFPFINLITDIQAINLLESFADELSKPVDPNTSSIDYIPTQYICELIKLGGYDGIKFKSSLGKGNNIVLFDTEKVKVINAKLYKVKEIYYEYDPYPI